MKESLDYLACSSIQATTALAETTAIADFRNLTVFSAIAVVACIRVLGHGKKTEIGVILLRLCQLVANGQPKLPSMASKLPLFDVTCADSPAKCQMYFGAVQKCFITSHTCH